MSRISTCFAELAARGERALIPYLTAGYPTPKATPGLLRALVRGGADIIELGVPFSDPIADGPTIQRASSEALLAGTTLSVVLNLVQDFRATGATTPIVLFGAYNPFFHYGMERFTRDAAAAGVDGVLIPDLPADEGAEAEPLLRTAGLDLIYLVAPTTALARKRQICSQGSGFIYYISLKGVTGARTELKFDLEEPVRELRSCSKLPVAVGFGISTPAQAALVGRSADGVVVGSALIDLISKSGADAEARVEEFIRSLKSGLMAAPAPAGPS